MAWFFIVIIFFPVQAYSVPEVKDKNLHIDKVIEGLSYPTTIEFLGENDFLVLEKDNGTVQRVLNGQLLEEPLIDLNISKGDGRGAYGLEVLRQNDKTFVFVSFLGTNKTSDFDDFSAGESPRGNMIYRYELINNSLLKPFLVRQLLTPPPGPYHYGGILQMGPDGYLYHSGGDHGGLGYSGGVETKARNKVDGPLPDGTSGITRMGIDGHPPEEWILGQEAPLNTYFAYGIRNSFGMAFDPVTGYLWDTENGDDKNDELNLVRKGFNSGWNVVQGDSINRSSYNPALSANLSDKSRIAPFQFLENFMGRGEYSDPEFIWKSPSGVTALTFLNTTQLGTEYFGDLFVADFVRGNIYNFNLNGDRTHLILNASLSDRIADTNSELVPVVFASKFEGITDMDVGPDGNLYVVSHRDGTVYKITPNELKTSNTR